MRGRRRCHGPGRMRGHRIAHVEPTHPGQERDAFGLRRRRRQRLGRRPSAKRREQGRREWRCSLKPVWRAFCKRASHDRLSRVVVAAFCCASGVVAHRASISLMASYRLRRMRLNDAASTPISSRLAGNSAPSTSLVVGSARNFRFRSLSHSTARSRGLLGSAWLPVSGIRGTSRAARRGSRWPHGPAWFAAERSRPVTARAAA